jgi:hypothetical protein
MNPLDSAFSHSLGRTRTFALPKSGHPTPSLPKVCAPSASELLLLPLCGYAGAPRFSRQPQRHCPGGQLASACRRRIQQSYRRLPVLDANPERHRRDSTNRFTPTMNLTCIIARTRAVAVNALVEVVQVTRPACGAANFPYQSDSQRAVLHHHHSHLAWQFFCLWMWV